MCYDSFAAMYDKALAPFERLFLAKWRKTALSSVPENAMLIEIGAGTGLNFPHYLNFSNAVACEFSDEMIRFAKTKTAIGQLSLVQTDAQILPFASDSFDAGLATLVFCSIKDPEKAFAELRRVVRNNGRIVLLEHVRPENPLGYLFDLFNFLTSRLFEDHFNRRTAETVRNSGFRIVDLKRKAFGIVNLIVCEVEK